MQADFSVELGADDATLELPWAAPEGPRYYNLKRQPELLLEIEEARRFPELGEFLAAINGAPSLFETAKCDAWASAEMNVEDEIFGASHKFCSYADLVFCNQASRVAFAEHEQRAKQLTALLRKVPEIPAAVEFLIRRCYYRGGEDTQEGCYITAYVLGYGEGEEQAKQRWAIGLKLLQNAIRQLSAHP